MKNETIIALLYDFDKTLCPKDMQEYGFIDSLDLSADEFWATTAHLADKIGMDKILAYMYQMFNLASKKNIPLTQKMFLVLGTSIQFFPGVLEWFEHINELGSKLNLKIEHYIISSGLKEIIEGTQIAKYFKEIYACGFLYNHQKRAVWPKTAVNYTTKTQFLFRISKGIINANDDIEVNKFIPNEKRRIRFENMIYIGDGLTDVPCMKLIKERGGKAIAVYQNNQIDKVQELIKDNRVDFIAEADYQNGSSLEKIISLIIQEKAIENELFEINITQKNNAVVK